MPVTFEVFLPSVSFLFILLSFLWNEKSKTHADIYKKLSSIDGFDAHIASMRSDLVWIKEALKDLKHR